DRPAFRQPAPCQAPEAKAEHERRDDDGHRFDIDAEDEEQRALPGELVDERGKPGDEEQHAEDARLRRKPCAAPRSTAGRCQSEACHAPCPLKRAGMLGREPYPAVNLIHWPFKPAFTRMQKGPPNRAAPHTTYLLLPQMFTIPSSGHHASNRGLHARGNGSCGPSASCRHG